MKHTMYFDTVADFERYFPDGVPSNVLAIVKDTGGMYTSSNNESSGGSSQEQGGEPISDEDREYVDWTLEGEPEPEPELEDGWYAVGDTGDTVPLIYETEFWYLQINNEGSFMDFPCYFMYVENGVETPYYTQHDNVEWTTLDNTDLDNNADKYQNNRITCANERIAGGIKLRADKTGVHLDAALQ